MVCMREKSIPRTCGVASLKKGLKREPWLSPCFEDLRFPGSFEGVTAMYVDRGRRSSAVGFEGPVNGGRFHEKFCPQWPLRLQRMPCTPLLQRENQIIQPTPDASNPIERKLFGKGETPCLCFHHCQDN